MDERIKNLGKAVVNVDDRLINVEKAITSNTTSSNDNHKKMMEAMTNFSHQMDKNNQTVAYLLSVANPNIRQNMNQPEQAPPTSGNFLSQLFGKTNAANIMENNQDHMMYEQNHTDNKENENYMGNMEKQDYQSESMMSQTYIN
jgi:hypothetical protein